MTEILIQNGTVITLGNPNKILYDTDVLIEGSNILSIGKRLPRNELTKVINANGRIVMPAFINTHMHFYSSFATGLNKAKPSKNFYEILQNLWWRLDKKLTLEDVYYSAKIAMINAIKKGSTTIFDHHASPHCITGSLSEIAKAATDCGLRVNLCYEVSDRDGEQICQEGIYENLNFIKWAEKNGDGKIKGMFGLHAAFTLSDKTLEKVTEKCSAEDTGFHIHCAEDKKDQDDSLKLYHMSVIERLNHFGILGKRTILGHGVHLNDKELDIIKNKDSILVHNPQSNMNNAVGVANVLKMVEMNILTGLGTDAMTSNMLEELRVATWLQKLENKDPSVGFLEACKLLVENNQLIAERFFKKVGVLKEGWTADIIIMDYYPYTELGEDNFLGHLVFGLPNATVDTTISSGKILMTDKRLVEIDEVEISEITKEFSRKFWKRF